MKCGFGTDFYVGFILARVFVSPRCDFRPHCFQIGNVFAFAVFMGDIYGKSSSLVFSGWIGSGPNKNFYCFQITVARGPMKRRVAGRFLEIVSGTNGEKVTNYVDVPGCSRTKQSSFTNRVSPVYVGAGLY